MITCITASKANGRWRLTQQQVPGVLSGVERERLREARDRGAHINLDSYAQMGVDAGVWRLEWSKAALEHGEIALGLAAQLVDGCLSDPAERHSLRVPTGLLDLRTVKRMLLARGERVRGSLWLCMADAIAFVCAVVAACVMLIHTLWQCRREGSAPPRGIETALATHGEWSNRTRHVLSRTLRPGVPFTIMVLGRPRLSLAQFEGVLRQNLGEVSVRLLRPFSLAAALHAAPRGLKLCLRGVPMVMRQLYRPPFRELVAMNYRCLLGAASAQWWRSGGYAESVIYGHTGLADTTQLELAQQSAGTVTTHQVHGISGGLNFIGYSSVARFQCQHDAHWHERLGGYGACVAEVAVAPSFVKGKGGMLFLSNHVHPMNPWFKAFGATDETESLRLVAEAADKLGLSRREVVWKPHPVFSRIDPDVREQVLSLVAELGLSLWPDSAPLAHAADFRFVISTRSTVALDMLREGVLPIILDVESRQVDDAVSHFPLHAKDAAGIAGAVAAMEGQKGGELLFGKCWMAIGPATLMSECMHAAYKEDRPEGVTY